MSYVHRLLGISAAFVLLEWLFPWREGQGLPRRGWLRDLGFLALNGHFYSLLTAGAIVLMGVSPRQAIGTVRPTLGRSTSLDDVERAAAALAGALENLACPGVPDQGS